MTSFKFINVTGLLFVSSFALELESRNLDNRGFYGAEKQSLIVASSDISEGGNSSILGISDSIIRVCIDGEDCDLQRDISNVFIEVDYTNYFYSQFKITDYVPSSQLDLGWASVGWWVIPSYNSDLVGESVFDKAVPAGLIETSWLSMRVSYTVGETLTVELKGDGLTDELQSAPRFSYVGSGGYEHVVFPLKAIKRDSSSVPKTYDASKVSSIGFLRLEKSTLKASVFPSSVPEVTEFKLECFGLGPEKMESGCYADIPGGTGIDPVLNSSEGVILIGKEVQVYSVSGEEVWSGLWNGSLVGFSMGLYFVKWQDQILKFKKD